jgi:hypothetical protein
MEGLTKSRHLNEFPLFSINFKVRSRKSTAPRISIKTSAEKYDYHPESNISRQVKNCYHNSRFRNEINGLCHFDVNYF